MPFPLLRLPWVALDQVMRCFDLQELFNISKTSKIVEFHVRSFSTRNIRFELKIFTTPQHSTVFLRSLKNAEYQVSFQNSRNFRFILDLSELIKTFSKTFQISSATLAAKKSYTDIFELLDLLKELEIGIAEVNFHPPDDSYSSGDTSELDVFYSRLLEESIHISKSYIHIIPSENYQFPTSGFQNRIFRNSMLKFKSANWLTVPILTEFFLEVNVLIMDETSMTMREIVEFLKIWMTRNSETVQFKCTAEEFGEIRRGMQGVDVHHVVLRGVICTIAPGYGFVIEETTVDGTMKKCLGYYGMENMFIVTTEFELCRPAKR